MTLQKRILDFSKLPVFKFCKTYWWCQADHSPIKCFCAMLKQRSSVNSIVGDPSAPPPPPPLQKQKADLAQGDIYKQNQRKLVNSLDGAQCIIGSISHIRTLLIRCNSEATPKWNVRFRVINCCPPLNILNGKCLYTRLTQKPLVFQLLGPSEKYVLSVQISKRIETVRF